MFAIFARNSGNWEYEMVWGDFQRVFLDAGACRLQKDRLNSLVQEMDGAPEGLEYTAEEVDPDEEIAPGETASDHLAAIRVASILAGARGATH